MFVSVSLCVFVFFVCVYMCVYVGVYLYKSVCACVYEVSVHAHICVTCQGKGGQRVFSK